MSRNTPPKIQNLLKHACASTMSLAKSCGPKFLNCLAVSLRVPTWRNCVRP